jgi:CBS domain-containing protein
MQTRTGPIVEEYMFLVRDLLKYKGTDVWTITPDKTVYDALVLMATQEIGALVVVENDRVCGMLSERDYARKVVLKGRSSSETTVRDIMTPKVLYVSPDKSVDDCMALMTGLAVRHLPVLNNDNELAGLISIGDVVRSVISQQEFVINQLESYITGS